MNYHAPKNISAEADLDAWRNLGNRSMSLDHNPTPPANLWAAAARYGEVTSSIRGIADAVAHRHRMTFDDLKGPSRKRKVFLVRAEAMYRARCVRWPDGTHRWPYTVISRVFGGRDHTTAINAVERHCALNGLDYPA